MQEQRHKKSSLLLVSALLLAVVLVFPCAATALLWHQQSMDYPGAVIVSQHTRGRFLGHPFLRRDASYRTTDPFPAVYNWYSTGFAMGPESHAMGSCIVLERSRPLLVVEYRMGVTICDAQNQRMIFVERTLSLR